MKLKKTEIHIEMSTKLTHRHEAEEDTPTAQKKKKLFLLSSSWIKDDNSIN